MAPASKAPAAPQVDEETMNAIRKRLIETGDWERSVPTRLPLSPCAQSTDTRNTSALLSLRLDAVLDGGDEPSDLEGSMGLAGLDWADARRISGLLRDKLEEVGFADDLKDFAKGEAGQ